MADYFTHFSCLLDVGTPVFPARLRNRAGIVGAAMAVASHLAP